MTPGGEPPRDVRLRTSPVTESEAESALAAWKRRHAEHQAERDALVRAAYPLLGRNVRRIARLAGLSRNTVYAILGADRSEKEKRTP